MKSFAQICLYSCLSSGVFGNQDSLHQRIGIIGEIPLLIETGNSIYSSQNETIFEIAPGRLLIFEPPRGRAFNFDHLIQKKNSKPLPAQRITDIQVLYCYGDTLKSEWKPAIKKYIDSSLLILEATLKKSDTLWVGWRENPNDVPRSYLCFRVVERTPEITGYRMNTLFDTSRKPQRLEQLAKHRAIDNDNYIEFSGSTFHVPPGSVPEFRIKNYKLLTDKIISYRLIDKDNNFIGDWKITDFVLALPGLLNDKTYGLELKFPGQQVSSIYTLTVGLYWYEKTWIRVIGIFILIALTILLTSWFYRRRLAREKDTRARVEEQLRTLQSRLNPHFIFNALSSIEGLVSSGQNREANHYLSLFSDILRQTLEHSGELSISLSEDLELLDRYLRIEQLRFGFYYTIHVEPGIDTTTLDVPPMLMQPLVENAVKHGVSDKGEKGEINVEIKAVEQDIIATISDNGTTSLQGISTRGPKTAGGHGLHFTRQRLAEYAKLHPLQPIEFSIDHQPTGTTVSITYRNLLA